MLADFGLRPDLWFQVSTPLACVAVAMSSRIFTGPGGDRVTAVPGSFVYPHPGYDRVPGIPGTRGHLGPPGPGYTRAPARPGLVYPRHGCTRDPGYSWGPRTLGTRVCARFPGIPGSWVFLCPGCTQDPAQFRNAGPQYKFDRRVWKPNLENRFGQQGWKHKLWK